MPRKSLGFLNSGASSKPYTTGSPLKPALLALFLPVLLWTIANTGPAHASRQFDISRDSLEATTSTLVGFGTRFAWTSRADSAAFHLKRRCETLGLPTRLDTVIYLSGNRWRRTFNVVTEITGISSHSGKVVLGAHYDSIDVPSSYTDSLAPAPGADDNATGCSALLEIARVIKDLRLERTIEIVFFGAEELGRWGSVFHAANARAEGDSIIAMLSLDAIGYDADGTWDVEIRHPDDESRWLAEACARAYAAVRSTVEPELVRPVSPYQSVSDHVSFWEAGFTAVHVFEGAGDPNPHLNSRGDSLSLVDFDFLRETTEAIAHLTAITLGEAEITSPPKAITIVGTFPNPFTDTATIRYDLRLEGVLSIDVFDAQGRMVDRLFHGTRVPDTYTITWNGGRIGGERAVSGIYFVRFSASDRVAAAKVVLIR